MNITLKSFIEMVLNGIIIGIFANIVCPNVHKFVELVAKKIGGS